MNAELAYGDERRSVAASTGYVDRGKDWPLAALFFTPVIAAYLGIGYGIFLVGSRLL